jgi:hypothetical protein
MCRWFVIALVHVPRSTKEIPGTSDQVCCSVSTDVAFSELKWLELSSNSSNSRSFVVNRTKHVSTGIVHADHVLKSPAEDACSMAPSSSSSGSFELDPQPATARANALPAPNDKPRRVRELLLLLLMLAPAQ